MRIGYGYDAHCLAENRKLVLGGVDIPYEKGLLGHSDADVLVHSVMDAILGAMAWGDIGSWFPDTDGEYRDADSRQLLRRIVIKLYETEWRVCNLDSTICAEQPKLRPYIDGMRENLAADLQVSVQHVSVKATTEEGLGVSGNCRGISATAVVLLVKRDAKI